MFLKIKKSICQIKPYVPGRPIDEVKRQFGLKNVIKLASNENPYGPSPKVLKAIEKAALTINRYPHSDCYYLRKTLARNFSVRPGQLIFGNGSDEVIVLAVRALVNEGDEVIIAKPSFLIYEIASRIQGAIVKEIPLKNFYYDLESMKRAVTDKTKIIFIGNPDNPSGKYLSETTIRDFLKGIRKNILVFLDEAYYEYVQARDYVNSINLLKTYENVLITRTFSKMYGLAGLRIGYGIGRENFIEYLNRLREPFNVNSLAQAAAVACLKDRNYYLKMSEKINEQRHYLYQSLKDLSLEYVDSFTNFILIRCLLDASRIAGALLKKGIIVRDMSPWGLNHYIRVTIGKEEENRKFVRILKKII